MSFGTYAGSREAFDALCEGVAESNDRRKTLERLGYDAYASFFERHDFPETDDTDKLLATEFAAASPSTRKRRSETVYVEDGTESALKKLVRIHGRNYFEGGVDAFETSSTHRSTVSTSIARRSFPSRNRTSTESPTAT